MMGGASVQSAFYLSTDSIFALLVCLWATRCSEAMLTIWSNHSGGKFYILKKCQVFSPPNKQPMQFTILQRSNAATSSGRARKQTKKRCMCTLRRSHPALQNFMTSACIVRMDALMACIKPHYHSESLEFKCRSTLARLREVHRNALS
jgi:hypothetical protein